jgi:hypothetical protein
MLQIIRNGTATLIPLPPTVGKCPHIVFVKYLHLQDHGSTKISYYSLECAWLTLWDR